LCGHKAAEHRRTPKRGRELDVHFALAFWSAVLLHRFSAPVEKQKGFPLIRVAFMFPK